ncbi:MAG TPA: ABC transporter substrate-binding protein [Stellaceae bacterium]|jgi:ABC-type nitrate/sulfonate/bicarbonate transport system substrate-binding protein|nr:ABC transporter substrate-binding protein [Stellaceae bacterium]
MRTNNLSRRDALILAASGVAALSAPRIARAATKLRVAKANPHAISFAPLDVGVAKGFFPGLDSEIVNFAGSAKAMAGLMANAADIYLGGGTDIAFEVKGVPITAVAALAGPPLLLTIIVPYDSPIKTADELKGKTVQVSTKGSTTDWLFRKLAETKGWGPDGIITVPMGGELTTQVAALRTHQVDAIIGTASLAFELEEKKEGRLLIPTADYVKDFLLHAIFATNTFLQNDPDAVRGFLKGWFQSIAFMRANREETLKIILPVTQVDEAAEGKEYDLVMPMFSTDGKFDAKSLDVMAQSFIDLKILDAKPDMAKLVTEKYLAGA